MAKASAKTARKLAALSIDCSFLLTHLVRQNTKPTRTQAEARDILKSILAVDKPSKDCLLKAGKVGWYGNAPGTNIFRPTDSQFDTAGHISGVCFTESTLAGLRAHRDVFNARYGIGFDRDELFACGANPCLNVRRELFRKNLTRTGESHSRSLYNFVPRPLLPFVNIIHSGFDATHEREWRISGDHQFEISDVMFVFCPEDDFNLFAPLQTEGVPTLFDLDWLDRV